MKTDVQYRPAYTLAICRLEAGESLCAESGAMVSMSANIQVQAGMRGGFFGALKRSVLGGESFFMTTFVCNEEAGEVTLAPSLPGDIQEIDLGGGTLFLQSGAYLASAPTVHVETQWGGAKTFFSREGLFLLRCAGQGSLLFSSYGALHSVTLQAGQRYVVDTGHMVAFTPSVQYNVRAVGGIGSTLFSGEGLVCDLTGPGRIWLQTRSEDSFLSWLIPRLPKSS